MRNDSAVPITRQSILNTVRICEEISQRLYAVDARAEEAARRALTAQTASLAATDPGRGIALVTGSSGFLGRPVLERLRSRGWHVRALVRRTPSARQQVPGIEYVECDLGRGVPPALMQGVTVVAHLAAEPPATRRHTSAIPSSRRATCSPRCTARASSASSTSAASRCSTGAAAPA